MDRLAEYRGDVAVAVIYLYYGFYCKLSRVKIRVLLLRHIVRKSMQRTPLIYKLNALDLLGLVMLMY